jgi:uncharacterized protein (TIGR03437 family)
MFGTGLRKRSDLASVSGTIGGKVVPVVYAGETPGLVGLDQVNLGPLPRNLAGCGELDVMLQVDGKTTNSVMIAIK